MSNEELVLRYQGSQDKEERRALLDELYRQNKGLIHSAVNAILRDDPEDLAQEGFIGLAAAADTWSPDGGAGFGTYAFSRIKYAIWGYLESCGSAVQMPAFRKYQVFDLRKFCSGFEMAHGRQPTDKETMEALEVSRDQLEKIKRADTMLDLRSMSEPLCEEGLELGDTIADPRDMIGESEEAVQQEQLSKAVQAVLDDLGPREATIIRSRYMEGRSLRETGEDLGISLERVRQIEAKTFRKLRSSSNKKVAALRSFLEDRAVYYGYHMSGLSAFRTRGASSVELAVMAVEEKTRSSVLSNITE